MSCCYYFILSLWLRFHEFVYGCWFDMKFCVIICYSLELICGNLFFFFFFYCMNYFLFSVWIIFFNKKELRLSLSLSFFLCPSISFPGLREWKNTYVFFKKGREGKREVESYDSSLLLKLVWWSASKKSQIPSFNTSTPWKQNHENKVMEETNFSANKRKNKDKIK
jgi:hypothetical protein